MGNPTILVGNRTGGQGKTVISQLLHYGFSLAGHRMKVVAADSSNADGSISKLGQILSDVEELGIGARMGDVRDNANAAVVYWDRIGAHLKDGDRIIDLGANILPLVFDWADQRKARRVLQKSSIHLVVPVTAQRQSVIDALQMVELAALPSNQIPFEKIFLVYNSVHGSFMDLMSTAEMRNLQRMQQAGQLVHVDLGRCTSEVWERIEANFLSYSALAQMEYSDFAKSFSLDEFAASGAHEDFVVWLTTSLANFRTAGLLPAGLSEDSLVPAI